MSILYLLQFPYTFKLCIENLLLLIHVYIFPQRNFLYSFHIRQRLEQILGNPCWSGNGNILTLLVLSQKTDIVHTVIHSGGNSPVIYSSETFIQERIARFVVLITTDSMFLYTPSWEDYGVFQNTKDSS